MTSINPDAFHGLHTCDTAVLDGTPRPLAEVYCPACPDRQRHAVPAQRQAEACVTEWREAHGLPVLYCIEHARDHRLCAGVVPRSA